MQASRQKREVKILFFDLEKRYTVYAIDARHGILAFLNLAKRWPPFGKQIGEHNV